MANDTLTLFPQRAAIGSTDARGDVYMTPAFSRAMAALLERVGGPVGFDDFDLSPPGGAGADPGTASRVEELEAQLEAMRAQLAELQAIVGATPYAPPATPPAFSPLTFPTRNARGNGSWADLWVPDQKTFVDNVLSLRNNSRSPTGDIYGLAAICMLDAGGAERGAFGYSRNSALQPAGYYPDTVYVEYGDPFAGDAYPSSYKLICTMAATSQWFPGTSFIAMEADAKTGATIIRARGGQPISLAGGYALTEDLSVGYKTSTRQLLGGMGNTAWRIRERDTTDYCGWSTNMNDAGVQDDPTKPSWKVAQGAGIDEFRVARSPAGANAFVNLFRIDAQGRALFTGGGGVGYGAGSGGVVTQATSKTTGVTLNKPSGQITMNAAALAAGAIVLFYVSNSTVTTSDCVVVNLRTGMTYSPNYTLRVTSVEAGGFYVVLKNETAGALSEAVVFNFLVIKGAIS